MRYIYMYIQKITRTMFECTYAYISNTYYIYIQLYLHFQSHWVLQVQVTRRRHYSLHTEICTAAKASSAAVDLHLGAISHFESTEALSCAGVIA